MPPALLPVEPPARTGEYPRAPAPGEPVEMLRVGEDVYGVPDMATLFRWILEGRVARNDMVSQHGMRWSPIGDRPDFAIFFAAAERMPVMGPTLEPAPSPLAGLTEPPLRAEEFQIDEEVLEGAPPGQDFSDEAPAPADPAFKDPADEPEAISAAEDEQPFVEDSLPTLMDALPPLGERDEPTIEQAVGPHDEIPAELVAGPPRPIDDPELLPAAPRPEDLQAEARQLGFELGPDPDTQEATVAQAAARAHEELTDAFVASGRMGGTSGSFPRPPPVNLGPGPAPITLAPPVAAPDFLDEPEVPRKGPPVGLLIAGAWMLLLLTLGAAWVISSARSAAKEELAAAAREKPASAPVAAAPAEPGAEQPGAESTAVEEKVAADLAAAQKAATEQAAAQKAAADAAALKAAEKAAAEKAASANVAPEQSAAERAAAAEAARVAAAAKAEARAVAKAEADRVAAEKAAARAAEKAARQVKPAGTSAKALSDAGWTAMDNGDVQAAHGFFSRALQQDASSRWALYGRGYANEKLGDTVSARADYCAAQVRAGGDTELSRELAGGLRRIGGGC